MSDRTTIEPRENGPLVIKHARSVKHVDGAEVEIKEVIALCRCGHSKNKPFCDGSHNEVNFSSDNPGEAAGKDKVLTYEGREATVTYNPRLCSHAFECGKRAGEVFDPDQRPWIQPDNGSREKIEEVIAACPSGALALAAEGEPRKHLVMDGRAQFEIEKDGPYWVTDVERPEGPSAEGETDRKYTLCRCGMSGMKPFCDGTHHDRGWKAEE